MAPGFRLVLLVVTFASTFHAFAVSPASRHNALPGAISRVLLAEKPEPKPMEISVPMEASAAPMEEVAAVEPADEAAETPAKLDLVDAATLVFGFFLFLSFTGLLPGT